MADPLTLAALGAVAISEGIKFLYAQAGEFIKRRHEKNNDSESISVLHQKMNGEC